MNLPFTKEEFLAVFESYNLTIFPAQIIFYLLAFIVVFLCVKKNKLSDTFINLVLSFFWLWIGVVYHFIFFSKINPAANVFAILFILQGCLFFYEGYFKKNLSFSFRKDMGGYTALIVILYSLVIYPVLGSISGHSYPKNPTFGLPCPTTIFTFGVLILTEYRIKFYLMIIPLLWAVIGFTAAFKLGIIEDTGLILAALLYVVFAFKRPSR